MGEETDKAKGRIKQAAGALTGDDETRREGEREERKGQLKGTLDDAVDRAEDALESMKDKVSRKA